MGNFLSRACKIQSVFPGLSLLRPQMRRLPWFLSRSTLLPLMIWSARGDSPCVPLEPRVHFRRLSLPSLPKPCSLCASLVLFPCTCGNLHPHPECARSCSIPVRWSLVCQHSHGRWEKNKLSAVGVRILYATQPTPVSMVSCCLCLLMRPRLPSPYPAPTQFCTLCLLVLDVDLAASVLYPLQTTLYIDAIHVYPACTHLLPTLYPRLPAYAPRDASEAWIASQQDVVASFAARFRDTDTNQLAGLNVVAQYGSRPVASTPLPHYASWPEQRAELAVLLTRVLGTLRCLVLTPQQLQRVSSDALRRALSCGLWTTTTSPSTSPAPDWKMDNFSWVLHSVGVVDETNSLSYQDLNAGTPWGRRARAVASAQLSGDIPSPATSPRPASPPSASTPPAPAQVTSGLQFLLLRSPPLPSWVPRIVPDAHASARDVARLGQLQACMVDWRRLAGELGTPQLAALLEDVASRTPFFSRNSFSFRCCFVTCACNIIVGPSGGSAAAEYGMVPAPSSRQRTATLLARYTHWARTSLLRRSPCAPRKRILMYRGFDFLFTFSFFRRRASTVAEKVSRDIAESLYTNLRLERLQAVRFIYFLSLSSTPLLVQFCLISVICLLQHFPTYTSTITTSLCLSRSASR